MKISSYNSTFTIKHLHYRFFIIAILIAFLAGCNNTKYTKLRNESDNWETLSKHLINVNASGGIDAHFLPDSAPIDLSTILSTQEKWSDTECRFDHKLLKTNQDYLNVDFSIEHTMAAFHTWAQDQISMDRPVRVMLIIHGGVGSLEKRSVEANNIFNSMGKPDFFPIFVNWEAAIPKSYFDHLLNIREGKRVSKLQGYSTAPFVGFADVGRAIGRTPIFLVKQAGYFFGGQTENERVNESPSNWKHIRPPYSDRPRWQPLDWLTGVSSGSVRLISTPILDTIGTGAYQNMLRRTRLMFLLDSDFDQVRIRRCGAVSRLMDALRAYETYVLKGDKNKRDWGEQVVPRNRGDDVITRLRSWQVNRLAANSKERKVGFDKLQKELKNNPSILPITIVSHSLGAVIANEILHRNNDLYFDNVVYMAAASSIKDFASLALPYLDANPTTKFYNLTLHPYREANEIRYLHTVPEGSLLTWIDRFLVEPKSSLDKTLGSWNNLADSLPVFQYLEGDTRERFSVTVFDSTDATPQEHGDFNDPPSPCDPNCDKGYQGQEFWNSSFWMTEGAVTRDSEEP